VYARQEVLVGHRRKPHTHRKPSGAEWHSAAEWYSAFRWLMAPNTLQAEARKRRVANPPQNDILPYLETAIPNFHVAHPASLFTIVYTRKNAGRFEVG
jgi:hypothetical protein